MSHTIDTTLPAISTPHSVVRSTSSDNLDTFRARQTTFKVIGVAGALIAWIGICTSMLLLNAPVWPVACGLTIYFAVSLASKESLSFSPAHFSPEKFIRGCKELYDRGFHGLAENAYQSKLLLILVVATGWISTVGLIMGAVGLAGYNSCQRNIERLQGMPDPARPPAVAPAPGAPPRSAATEP